MSSSPQGSEKGSASVAAEPCSQDEQHHSLRSLGYSYYLDDEVLSYFGSLEAAPDTESSVQPQSSRSPRPATTDCTGVQYGESDSGARGVCAETSVIVSDRDTYASQTRRTPDTQYADDHSDKEGIHASSLGPDEATTTRASPSSHPEAEASPGSATQAADTSLAEGLPSQSASGPGLRQSIISQLDLLLSRAEDSIQARDDQRRRNEELGQQGGSAMRWVAELALGHASMMMVLQKMEVKVAALEREVEMLRMRDPGPEDVRAETQSGDSLARNEQER